MLVCERELETHYILLLFWSEFSWLQVEKLISNQLMPKRNISSQWGISGVDLDLDAQWLDIRIVMVFSSVLISLFSGTFLFSGKKRWPLATHNLWIVTVLISREREEKDRNFSVSVYQIWDEGTIISPDWIVFSPLGQSLWTQRDRALWWVRPSSYALHRKASHSSEFPWTSEIDGQLSNIYSLWSSCIIQRGTIRIRTSWSENICQFIRSKTGMLLLFYFVFGY